MEGRQETERRYGWALDICIGLLGESRLARVILPQDIQPLRVTLISERATSTVDQ
jgi:integrase